MRSDLFAVSVCYRDIKLFCSSLLKVCFLLRLFTA